jgi:hypothetical protein
MGWRAWLKWSSAGLASISWKSWVQSPIQEKKKKRRVGFPGFEGGLGKRHSGLLGVTVLCSLEQDCWGDGRDLGQVRGSGNRGCQEGEGSEEKD